MALTFFACIFCFRNTNHVLILRRFGPLFCSLRAHTCIFNLACALSNEKRVHAGIFNLACALSNEKRVHAGIFNLACAFSNERNKGPILLSIIT